MNDLVNHPDHYTQGIECWDYITSHKMGYLEGNIIKYVTRYKDKDGLKDLKKAAAYLNKLIEQEEEKLWPSQDECAKPIMPGRIPEGITYRRSPISDISDALEDVRRLNGAIPLPAPAPELWHGFPLTPLTPPCSLDGRNCSCGHSERGICSTAKSYDEATEICLDMLDRATPDGLVPAPNDTESYCLGDFHRVADWLKKAWINE